MQTNNKEKEVEESREEKYRREQEEIGNWDKKIGYVEWCKS